MRTEKEMEKYIAEQRILQARRVEIEKERLLKIIAAENLMTKLSNDFLDFLKCNHDKLIGKKLYNNDGISKYFTAFLVEFKQKCVPTNPIDSCYIQQSNLKLRANVNGGKYQPENSHYCDYIDRTFYDVIVCDEKGICTGIRETYSDQPIWDYEEMAVAKHMIRDYKKEIEKLQENIRNKEKFIPYYLHDSKHNY